MKWLPSYLTLLLAVFGGVYFGLFSCGGYVWHKHLFFSIFAISVLVAVLVPLRRARPVVSRVGLLLGAGVGFFLFEALAAPFYPASPESLSEFFRSFISTLQYGPC